MFRTSAAKGQYITSTHSIWYVAAMEHLIAVLQEMAFCHDRQKIIEIVRTAARELTGADGATFVLRDDNQCFYADEDAISPLWKGQRFPLSMCISGWVMEHATPVLIEDIYKDSRIPHDAYRPTFVKSMVMVPIRRKHTVGTMGIGAIGNYWAKQQTPSDEVMAVLQSLADSTAVALENAELHAQRAAELQALRDSSLAFGFVASPALGKEPKVV